MRAFQHIRLAALALVAAVALASPFARPAAAQTFPALTGRVVDEAGVLDPAIRATLTSKLAAFEAQTGDQLVVATVKSLQGYAIEDYANRLFRQWRLGQQDKNNGVLLLVAPADHKVRIEVGYGLEGALPDAVAKLIIEDGLVSRFRANQFGTGIAVGVDNIIDVLTDDAAQWKRRASASRSHVQDRDVHVIELPLVLNIFAITLIGGLFLLFFGAMGYVLLGALVSTLVVWGVLPKKADRHGLWSLLNNFDDGRARETRRRTSEPAWASSSSSSSSSGSSDSFSGGGGSSGGGGASGSW